jgi:hypothetical protein
MMLLKICLIGMFVSAVGYYMADRYAKIIIISIAVITDFHNKVLAEFDRRRNVAESYLERAKEFVGSDGELLNDKDLEVFDQIMREANAVLDVDFFAFTEEFYLHMKAVRSNMFWDWWKTRYDLSQYIDKKYLDFILK